MELTNNGIMVFLNKVVKPKLQLLLVEAARDAGYLISLESDESAYPDSDPDGEDEQEQISPKSRDALVQLRFRQVGTRSWYLTNECLQSKFPSRLILMQATFPRSWRTGFRDMLGGPVN